MKADNYRLLYETYYRYIPEDWEIHHIDYNHYNNDIENLVALPKELHRKLHQSYDKLCQYNLVECIENNWLNIHSGYVNNRTLFMEYLCDYINVIEECTKYMNIREGVY